MAEPIGAGLEAVARGGSRSAIFRRFKAATETALAELLARDLMELDVAVVMIDGIILAEVCCVVALAIGLETTPRQTSAPSRAGAALDHRHASAASSVRTVDDSPFVPSDFEPPTVLVSDD
jgi:hypothetical protein